MRLIRVPERILPPLARGDLPIPVSLRAMIGPGIVLAGLSIGSGEFVLWPRLTADWGFAVFWAAWIGVTIQFFLNMEIERYTLATGESAVVGFLRLSRVFGPVFLLCCSVPWIWPGWATGAGTILSWEIGGNATAYAISGLVLCGLVLSLGPVVYKTVEAIQFAMVGLIFAAVLVLALVVVRLDAVGDMLAGALRIGHVPDGIELPVLLGALAFAGAGGSANLAQSNYIRDKGYGMGRSMGRITSPITGEEEANQCIGVGFEGTPENLARWRVWWRRANVEHALTFYLLCIFSIAALSLITYTLLERGAPVGEDFAFIRDQGAALHDRFGPFAQHAFFAAGIAVLLSTEIAILDAVTRVLTDLIHTIGLRDRPGFSPSRVYFIVLWSLIAFGIAVLAAGVDEPQTLIVLSASLNAVVMALYSGLLLWLNLRSFAGPLRPSPLRIVALVGSLAFFGYFSVLTIQDKLA